MLGRLRIYFVVFMWDSLFNHGIVSKCFYFFIKVLISVLIISVDSLLNQDNVLKANLINHVFVFFYIVSVIFLF